MDEELGFDEIQIGQKACLSKTITECDIYTFAGITGDFNPVHIDSEFARKSIFKERIAHGMLTAGLVSAVLGTKLPGVNTIYLKQEVEFTAPVHIGDTITAQVKVLDKKPEKKIIRLQTIATNQDGKLVLKGEATVMKPVL